LRTGAGKAFAEARRALRECFLACIPLEASAGDKIKDEK
jgi:hypothetical protein